MNQADGLPTPRRYWAIVAISLATMLSVIDNTIANIALPTIAGALHISPADSILIVNIYQLMVVVAMLPLSALGDIIGHRRVYQLGLITFMLASIASGLSDSLPTLVIARACQGIGAAGCISVSNALIRATYPQDQLGRGIGINAITVALSGALGPTLGGLILSVAPWQTLFVINAPIALLSLIIGWFVLPKNERSKKPYDFVGATLNVLTFGLFIIGLTGFAHAQPWPITLIELALLLAIGTFFVRREMAQTAPILPLDLMRRPVISLSFAAAASAFIAMMLVMISVPFYLQNTAGFAPRQTGFAMMPWPLALAVMASISGYLADRYPAGLLGGLGLAIASCGMAALAWMMHTHTAGSIADVAWRTGLCGLGFSLFLVPNARSLISAAPIHRTGSMGGMIATMRLMGQATGAALAALIFTWVPQQSPFVAVCVATGVVLAAASISLLRLKALAAEKPS